MTRMYSCAPLFIHFGYHYSNVYFLCMQYDLAAFRKRTPNSRQWTCCLQMTGSSDGKTTPTIHVRCEHTVSSFCLSEISRFHSWRILVEHWKRAPYSQRSNLCLSGRWYNGEAITAVCAYEKYQCCLSFNVLLVIFFVWYFQGSKTDKVPFIEGMIVASSMGQIWLASLTRIFARRTLLIFLVFQYFSFYFLPLWHD